MQTQRKPTNLFAIRSRMRRHTGAMQTNAMYGMEAGDVIKEGNKGTVETHEQIEIRNGITELGITDAGMKSAPSPLAHSVDDSSGRMDSPVKRAAVSSTGAAHQSGSPKPDSGAQCEADPAAISARSDIIFRLKGGSSMPLSSQIDERYLSIETLLALKRLSETFEAKPHTRVPAEILPYVIRRCIQRSQKPA